MPYGKAQWESEELMLERSLDFKFAFNIVKHDKIFVVNQRNSFTHIELRQNRTCFWISSFSYSQVRINLK